MCKYIHIYIYHCGGLLCEQYTQRWYLRGFDIPPSPGRNSVKLSAGEKRGKANKKEPPSTTCYILHVAGACQPRWLAAGITMSDQTLGHNTQSLNPFALVGNILLHILGLLHRRPRLLCTWPISFIPQPNPFSQYVGTPTFDGENPQLSFSMAWSSRTFQERPRSPRLLGSQCLT